MYVYIKRKMYSYIHKHIYVYIYRNVATQTHIVVLHQNSVFGIAHDHTINKAVRDRKEVMEWHELGTFKAVFEELEDMFEAMRTQQKEKADVASGSAGNALAPEKASDPSDVTKTFDLLKRVGIDGETISNMQALPEESLEKLVKFRDMAKRLANTYITVVLEEPTESRMAAALANTPAGKLRGATDKERQSQEMPVVAVGLFVALVFW